MTEIAPVHPSPARARVSFYTLMFAMTAAPIFWIGQMILSYTVSDAVCFKGDHPIIIANPGPLQTALAVFDAVAVVFALAGLAVSFWCWRKLADEREGGINAVIGEGRGRARFMAVWGILSSIWFLCAIVFNVIVSLGIPPCAG